MERIVRFLPNFYRNDGNLIENLKSATAAILDGSHLEFRIISITKERIDQFSLNFYRNDGNLIENTKKLQWLPSWMATILDFE